MADFITLQMANEEVDRLRVENKDLRDEIYALLEIVRRDRDYWMTKYQTDILCFKDENSHLRAMNQRMIEELVEIAPLKKSLKKTYENGYNFTAVEMDWVVRGLFALHKQQPPEAAAIQQLINKLANTVYQVEPLTDEEIKECSYDAEGFMISREKAMRNVEKAHGIGEKDE